MLKIKEQLTHQPYYCHWQQHNQLWCHQHHSHNSHVSTGLTKPMIIPGSDKEKQGNYSLRRPPKLIIPKIFIGQIWATVYRFMCKQICINNKANMTRALMRVQFWVNGQYSPRTEPTEQPIFTQNWTHWTSSVLGKRPIFTQNWTGSILGGRPIFTQNWTNWMANIHPELSPLNGFSSG